MVESRRDEIVLSYHDVVLRKSDLAILNGPNYLNDRIIEFYFAHLTSHYNRSDILMIQPAVSFWIANCPDHRALGDFLKPLDLATKKLVIFTVNDNEDVTKPEGGTHWSLLVFVRRAELFVHHDSFNNVNCCYAKRLSDAVAGYMGVSRVGSDVYTECGCVPQQVNGYDCGLYVLAIARIICSFCDSADRFWNAEMAEFVTPAAIAQMRREILELIQDMALGRCVDNH